MSVNLKKGQRVNLTKGTGITKYRAGLGWDTNRYQGSADFDLDLIAFLCGEDGKCIGEPYMIFYGEGHGTEPEKACQYSGDNRTGAGDGDDEWLDIDFAKISPKVKKVVIAVSIYDAKARSQNFGLVDNAFIRLIDPATDEELYRYDLTEDFDIQTSVIFGEFYEKNGDWKFVPVGEGYEKELVDLCHEYGIAVE